jgi:hypothetical protein
LRRLTHCSSRRSVVVKEFALNPSLTVVVPVHNAQSFLPAMMEEMLEVVPELTSRFEVILVDDGSTDATVDTAQELSLRFPQVQLLLQPMTLGPQEALRSALKYSHGEMLLLCAARTDLDLHEITKLWSQRTADEVACAQVATRPSGTTSARTKQMSHAQSEGAIPDLLLLPRRLLTAWHNAAERHSVVTYLRTRGFTVRNVAIRSRKSGTAVPRPAMLRQSAVPQNEAEYRVQPATPGTQRRRTNGILTKLRSFTRGE